MSEQLEKIFRIREHVTTRMVDGEAFIMDLGTLHTYFLNKTAAFVWSLLDGVKSMNDICIAVADRFDVDPETCNTQVVVLLGALMDEHLVSTVARNV